MKIERFLFSNFEREVLFSYTTSSMPLKHVILSSGANGGCQKCYCHSTCLGILGIIDLPCCDEGEIVCKEHQQSQGHHVQLHGPDGDHKHLGGYK